MVNLTNKTSNLGFISTPTLLSLPRFTTCTTYYCKYFVAQYRDDLFSKLGIQFDDCLIRATSKRKAEFLAGRVCAKTALISAGTGTDLLAGHVAAGTNRSPVFPYPFSGSISHTNDSAVCTISNTKRTTAIGIDEEKWVSPSIAHQLHTQILDSKELIVCTSMTLQFNQALTIFFSAKESFFKAYFSRVNRHFGFHDVKVCSVKIVRNRGFLHLMPNQSIVKYLPPIAYFTIYIAIKKGRVITYHCLQQ